MPASSPNALPVLAINGLRQTTTDWGVCHQTTCYAHILLTHGCVPMPTPDDDHIPASPDPVERNRSIAETAQLTGISASVLRVWETRYGWPRPERDANDYRSYPPALVAILMRVGNELSQGKSIGDLMRDAWWQQVFETGAFPKPPRVRTEPPWATLPQPATSLGRDVRQRLQQALVSEDARQARYAQAMGERLRPEERECAVKAVLRMWHGHR